MKNPFLWLTIIAVFAFGIAGFNYLGTATDPGSFVVEEARTPSLVAGITCLLIAIGLLVFGAFWFRMRNSPEGSGS